MDNNYPGANPDLYRETFSTNRHIKGVGRYSLSPQRGRPMFWNPWTCDSTTYSICIYKFKDWNESEFYLKTQSVPRSKQTPSRL
jgi:hypothetical protein